MLAMQEVKKPLRYSDIFWNMYFLPGYLKAVSRWAAILTIIDAVLPIDLLKDDALLT